jgi:hypothetical protein
MRLAALALLIACSGPAATEDGSDTDTVPLWSQQDTDTTATTADTDDTTVPPGAELNGTAPASPLGPPSFAAVSNRDGQPRVPADLVGHPTVMWFYPAANTGG